MATDRGFRRVFPALGGTVAGPATWYEFCVRRAPRQTFFEEGMEPVPRQCCRPPMAQEQDALIFARERLGFEPDAKQAEVLRSEAKQGILNCSRQWGKSTTAAAKAVHRAYTKPESVVLVAAPTLEQSSEFVWKAAGMLRKLGIRPRADGVRERSLLLPNGSRIVGLPGKDGTIRGFSAVSMLIIDEASRVSDAVYMALRPMLAVGEGELWLMSTPHGKRGFFYETWVHGGADWERVTVQATDCPRFSQAFIERERRSMGIWFEQEFMCNFVDRGAGAFDRDLVEAAMEGELEPLDIRPLLFY